MLCFQIWFIAWFSVLELLCETYLNDVEDNVLVEAVQDTFGYTVVIPGSMDKQQILQVFELCGREVNGGKRKDEWIAEVCVQYTVWWVFTIRDQCWNTKAATGTSGLKKAAAFVFP